MTTASDGAGALRSAARDQVDAVVLDIGLPDADGRDVCQAMRAGGMTAPVLFLTARDAVTDRLSGFAAGGDDYLGKPFHLAELVARLEVAMRRSPGAGPQTDGDLRVDPATHDVTGPAGSVALTPTEFRLLARLLAEPRAVVRRTELVAAAWAHGSLRGRQHPRPVRGEAAPQAVRCRHPAHDRHGPRRGLPGAVRTPSTLQQRLALVALATTAAWVLALTVLFNLLLVAQLRNQADDVLRTRAAAAVSTVDVDAAGRLTVREPPNDAALDAGVWVFQGASAVDRAPARAAVQRAADALTRGGRRFVEVGGSPPARLYAEPLRQGGRRVGTVVTATSLEPYRRTSQTALVGSAIVALLLVAGAYLVTRRVVARALAPVTEMAGQAAQWSAHDVGHRFGDAPRPGELRDLAASLDAVLDRIGAVLRHEQQLAAELSHELRTPLALVAAETDLLRSGTRSAAEREQAYAVIAETTDRMAELLDSLLAQAAHVVTESPGRSSVEQAVRAALAHTDLGQLRTSVSVPTGLEAGVSEAVLGRILAPLLGNAARYAESSITLTARRDPHGVQVTVVDDGPGVPAGFAERLFEPGQRADPDDGHGGAGLGLALALRLAHSSGGEIRLLDNQASGAAFLVTLPPA